MFIKLFLMCLFSRSVLLLAGEGATTHPPTTLEQELEHVMFAEQASEYLKTADKDSHRPPIVLIPGLLSSRLIAWKAKKCRGPDISIQDIIWLNLQKMVETTTYDRTCWLDCLKLGKNGSDPKDCKLRPDEGLSAIGELSPGNLYTPPATSIFTPLIKYLATEMGYDCNTLVGSPYDWRLSPWELEKRDSFFTTLKFRLETTVKRHRRPAIVMAHSMGNNLFLYFCDWLRLEDRPAMGYRRWLRRHVWAYVGFAAPLLGAPMALKSVMSGHNFGLTISEAQARELQLTFASTHFLNPRSTPAQRARAANPSPSPNNTSSGSSGATQDYEVPIVSIKSATGESSVQFGLADIENGEIFRWVASMWGEPLMMEKHSQLFSLYHNDPLQPLQNLPRRPPIRHVMMVYGVDLPTEVGYVYRLEKGGDGAVLPPVLAEILYEETVCQDGRGAGGAMGSAVSTVPRESGAQQCAREDSYAVAARRSADSEGGDSSPDSGERCPAEEILQPESPPLAEAEGKAQAGAARVCRVDIVSRARRTGRTGVHVGRAKTVKTSSHRRSGDITVPILSLSYAHAWLDVDAEGRENPAPVGGEADDGTGPRRWQEHRPERVHRGILENWMGSIGSRVATVDPAVDLFHSEQADGDSTAVVEVSGVDHLDITKTSFCHALVLEMLLPRMGKELALGPARGGDQDAYEQGSGRAPPTVWARLRGLLGLAPARRDNDAEEELSAFEFLVPSRQRSLQDDLLIKGSPVVKGMPGLEVPGRKRAMVRLFLRRLRKSVFGVKRSIDALLISLIKMQSADSYY